MQQRRGEVISGVLKLKAEAEGASRVGVGQVLKVNALSVDGLKEAWSME